MATSTTLAHYILDRISQDISFLAETGFLTKDDEDLILKRLASAQVPITPDQPAAVTQPIKVEREVSLASSMVSVPSPASMPLQSPQYPLKQVRALTGTTPIAAEHVNALKRAVPPPPTPPVKLADYARALWDYNVDGNVSITVISSLCRFGMTLSSHRNPTISSSIKATSSKLSVRRMMIGGRELREAGLVCSRATMLREC